jgi:hypothetical protein
MSHRATGPFDVKLTPQSPQGEVAANPGRMLIDKEFHGELKAISRGQMLSVMATVKGSAGYVAIEEVTGTLHGRHGSFVLQHFAIMNRGIPESKIVVVPDSGTGDLTGLTGTMTIQNAGEKHRYEFDYSLDSKLS